MRCVCAVVDGMLAFAYVIGAAMVMAAINNELEQYKNRRQDNTYRLTFIHQNQLK